jgi:TRAP-type C4-dicarboxylate transport system substrate-binding protein
VFVAFKYHDAAPHLLDTQLWALVSIALVSKAWYDRLPADLQKAVRETGERIEPELDTWQVARIAKDTKDWIDRGGKIAKLSAPEQADAVARVTKAIQPILDKSAPLKEFYNKVKAGAATVK